MHTFDEDDLEVTLGKLFFGLTEDIKILFTYASPINSCYTKARTMNILEKIETQYIDGGNNYIIMGDLNGRTKLGEDFVRDGTDDHSPINIPFYNKDSQLNRQNMDDHTIDTQGKLILEICKTSGLRILNGRTTGDPIGKFTRYPTNLDDKPSVIDYALCSEPLLQEIPQFRVLPFSGMSDHCSISLKILTNKVVADTIPVKSLMKVGGDNTSKHCYTYDKTRKHVYENSLAGDGRIKTLHSFLESDLNGEKINQVMGNLNDILLTAAKKSCFIKKFKILNNQKKYKSHNWYNKECKGKRDILRQLSKSMSQSPFDKSKRQKFVSARSAYKKACRETEKAFRRKLTDTLKEYSTVQCRKLGNI